MKKNRIIMSVAILAMAVITLNSCQKSDTEPAGQASDKATSSDVSSQNFLSALPYALAAYEKEQRENGSLKSGAEFIPVWFTYDGFGIGKNIEIEYDEDCDCFFIISGELGFFDTELDDNDFYRLNPDSTISVHISSNNANATYFNLVEGSPAFGSGANMTMHYTGAVVTFTYEWEGVLYTYQFIDTGSEPNAVVWHGAGKVQFDGTGPKHNLVAHLTANQGWTKVKTVLNIN